MTVEALRAPAPARWLTFVNAVFSLPVHVTYGAFWALGYECASALAHDQAWRPTYGSLLRAVTVVALLFFIRLVDERMDESYDRVHNPGRPLVTGVVTAAEAQRAGWLVCALVALVNVAYEPWSALPLAFIVVYAELFTRGGFAALRDRPLPHLLVAYPAQLAVGVYLYLSAPVHSLPAILVFAFAFLHYEFARKTTWTPAPRSYSATALGPVGSAAAALLAAVAACVTLALITSPWNHGAIAGLPYLSLGFAVHGAIWFFRGRDTWLTASSVLYLVFLYVGLVVSGVFG